MVVGMCYCVVHCKSEGGLVVGVCYCVVQVMGRCFLFLVKDREDFCHVDVDNVSIVFETKPSLFTELEPQIMYNIQ